LHLHYVVGSGIRGRCEKISLSKVEERSFLAVKRWLRSDLKGSECFFERGKSGQYCEVTCFGVIRRRYVLGRGSDRSKITCDLKMMGILREVW
jgi:hypothetical protein